MEDFRGVISPKIYIFYTENKEYRVCTNIDRYFAESIFRKENVKDRAGKVSKETQYLFKLQNIVRYQGEPLGRITLVLPN